MLWPNSISMLTIYRIPWSGAKWTNFGGFVVIGADLLHILQIFLEYFTLCPSRNYNTTGFNLIEKIYKGR